LGQLESQLSGEPEYWKERGRIELRLSPAEAGSSFDRALALAPDDADALNGAASASEAAKDDEKALSFLVRARKAHPDDVPTLLHFGTLCLRRDLTVDARDALERAYQIAPRNNLALFLYARVQVAFQQWQRAHDLFTDFVRRVPKYAPAYYALGWVDVKLNRPDEARQHFDKSLSLDPSQLDVRCDLGQLDLDNGDLAAAERELRAVVEKKPAHPKANLVLGDVLMRRGDLQQAMAHYEAAIAADPSSGPAHYKLSTVLMRLHEPERAEKERSLGAQLNARAEKASKVVLVLADPDGRTLRDAGVWKGVE
jgi:tetratricopeptide (TPR) repeat protein